MRSVNPAKRAFLSGFLVAGAATGLPIQAQTSSDDSVSALEEVVVTAQKRTERVQDVPISVSVLGSASLEAQQAVRLQDYFTQVPGLQVSPGASGHLSLALRGITTGGSTNPTVGITVDDVPVGSSSSLSYASLNATDIDPATLERIEVLRGPQGTLYGAASLGGLIRYVTTPPKMNVANGRMQVDGTTVKGGEEGYGVRGSGNIPLIDDKLAMTLSGFYRHDPGVLDNIKLGKSNVDGADVWGARASTLWQATEKMSLRLSATYQSTKGDGNSNVLSDESGHLTNGLTQQYNGGTGSYKNKVTQLDATLNFDLGWAGLTSITGYGEAKRLEVNDVTEFLGYLTEIVTGRDDLGSITLLPTHVKKFSQEVRLASPANQKLEWLLGLFYTHEDADTQYNIYAADPVTGELLTPVFPDAFPSKLKEKAVFGAATYHFTDQFDVQLGARKSQNDQDYEETILGPLYDPPYFVQASSKDNSFTYLASPRYRFNPNAMIYGRVATGYRPGGPNPGAGFGFPGEYGADKTISYEVGVKGDYLDRRLSLDASVYYINWKDIQLQQIDPATNFVYYTNAGKARSQGADFTVQAVPVRGLTAVASLSFNDAELREDANGGIFGVTGDRLPYSAKVTGSFALDQEFVLGEKYTGFVGGTLAYLGKRNGNFAANDTAVRTQMPSFSTLDLRTGVRTEDGWTLSLIARNVTDKRGVLGSAPEVGSGATGRYLLNVARPRTVGLSVAKQF